MIREDPPFPSPSSAPEDVMETAEIKKPALMRVSACPPRRMVSGLLLNSPISCSGMARQMAGSNKHDHRTHNQGDLINLPHTLMLACAVVEADNRAHALYNAVCCQIDERLQLVVNAEHDNVALGIHGQDSIQCGNQKRRQRQVQDRRDADRIQSSDQIFPSFKYSGWILTEIGRIL